MLENVNGFASLTTVSPEFLLSLGSSDVMAERHALSRLFGTIGYVFLTGLDNLASTGALSNITEIRFDLTLNNNFNIRSYSRLQNITSIGGDVHNLDAFNSVERIGGSFLVSNNPELADYCGLDFVLLMEFLLSTIVSKNKKASN